MCTSCKPRISHTSRRTRNKKSREESIRDLTLYIEYKIPDYESDKKLTYLICFETACKIKYKKDEITTKSKDKWKRPSVTLEENEEDCADKGAVLFRDMKKAGLKPQAIRGFGNKYKPEPHLWIEYNHPLEGILILNLTNDKIIRKKELESFQPQYLYIGITNKNERMEKLIKE